MKYSHKRTLNALAQSPTSSRLALLAISVFICCALIGAPVLSSVDRANNRLAQSEDAPNKDQADAKVSAQELFEIDYAGPKPVKANPVKSKPGGGQQATFNATSIQEIEPNNTTATAQALGGTSVKVRGNVYPNADVDFYSFTAATGDRVYAATMTSFSANASSDSQLTLLASDGTTQIEFDDDDGALGGLSSTISGATIPAPGTYFLKVNHFSATNQLRPYDLWFQLQSGSPTPEVEGNDTPATANPLPASGWVSGTRNPAAATEQDWFSITLAAGDTVFLSLNLDPERDNVQWNGRLGFALFGDAGNLILVVDDASTGSIANPLSEAFFMTVKDAGTYYAFVDSASAAVGGPTATYNLNVTVLPYTPVGINCTTYTSTDVPQTIGPGAGLVSSTITVPGNPRIASVRVFLELNHTLMADLDVHLRSPAGNDNGLFSDIGAAAVGGQALMSMGLDDFAGIPPLFTVMKGPIYQPELAYRLGWFKGEDGGGTWTLDIRDDTTNASGGTLTGWRIEICEESPLPGCGKAGSQTVYSSDFEADDGGFTHSGAGDEWERGTPAFAPITTANSGVNCWKTDLDNTYNASSSQDLLSPNINLAGISGPINLSWAQKYQMENTTFDHYFVEVREVGGTNPRKLFEWLDATMTDTIGNPSVTINESAGWAVFNADISEYAGQNIEVRFHLDSDTTVQLAGVAIDDVSVTGCALGVACTLTCPANITKSNDPNQCGAVVTYPAPTAEGDCGTVNCSPASGSFFPVGTTTVTCTASGGQIEAPTGEPGGGGGSCSFTVTVQDTQPPSITCPANITQSNDPNQCGAVVTYPAPTITDNCPGTFTATCTPASGSFFPVGTTTVTCTVNGGASPLGDPGAGGSFVVPEDKAPPPTGFKAGGTVGGTVGKGAGPGIGAKPPLAWYDGSGAVPGHGSAASFPASPYVTLYDQNNNAAVTATSSQNFEAANDVFDDLSADDFVVPAGQTWTVQQVNVDGIYFNGPGPATSVNVIFYSDSGTLPGAIVATRNTQTIVDTAGDFAITLTPTVVLSPGTYWVAVQANQNFTPSGQWGWTDRTVTSNSGAAWSNPGGGFGTPCTPGYGRKTICIPSSAAGPDNVFQILGTSAPIMGGGSTCTFTVTVNDTQPPSITCPANVTAVTDQNACPPPPCQVVNYPAPVATDNCPGVTVVCNPPAGSCFPTGVTTVTCTATDASGNTATCSFTVTTFDTALEDDSNPAIILLWNSITGQYRFCCNGITFTGVGKATRQGCVYTLDHTNAADRRVLGRVDKAVHAGSGSLQAPAGTTRCTITDRNTLNDPLMPACQ